MKDKQAKIYFIELLIKAYEGQISPDEVYFLNDSVRNNPDAVKWCVEFFDDVSVLIDTENTIPEAQVAELNSILQELSEYEKTAPRIEIPKENLRRELIQEVVCSPREKHKMSIFNKLVFTAAAAILFIVLFVKLVPEGSPSIQVATVVDQINVEWAQSNTALENGDRLWTNEGLMNLRKGIIELRYDDGVDVLIEGPALFEIERSGVYLEYGRLFSRVSESGLGFRVETPTSQFIDHGTEFGIQASIDGSSELHVIKGKVQLFAESKGKTKTGQMVTINQAVHYNNANGRIRSIPVNKKVFARKINSNRGTIWRGESLSLTSLVAGGNGFKNGDIYSGIDPATGQINKEVVQEWGRFGGHTYNPVSDRRFVDGVFVPNGYHGANIVSSASHTFDGFSITDNYYWSDITANPTAINVIYSDEGVDEGREAIKISLDENDIQQENRPTLFLHTNAGITFDLKKIREFYPQLELTRFTATCGIPSYVLVAEQDEKKISEFWVLVDGKCAFHHKRGEGDLGSKRIDIPIKPQDQFLTLATTDGGDEIGFDWCVFVSPNLDIKLKDN